MKRNFFPCLEHKLYMFNAIATFNPLGTKPPPPKVRKQKVDPHKRKLGTPKLYSH